LFFVGFPCCGGVCWCVLLRGVGAVLWLCVWVLCGWWLWFIAWLVGAGWFSVCMVCVGRFGVGFDLVVLFGDLGCFFCVDVFLVFACFVVVVVFLFLFRCCLLALLLCLCFGFWFRCVGLCFAF